ncbi:MAG: sugar ABC transporter ATP-binding protein [Limnochordaceae bacterium]|nr:sugar ABC transporter ATP-binding protein [Limnochordaceae bacterium]
MNPLLVARGLVKQFPSLRALDGVDLTLRPGEVHGLVGQNGAGKSTLIRVLTGVMQPDEGSIEVHGRPVRYRSPAEALADGIAVVHQELSLVRTLDAAENLFLGRPYPRRGLSPLVDWGRLRETARTTLHRLHPDIPVDVPVGRLSPALQTLVAIARALLADARVLILDEPTASLAPEEVRHLFDVIRALREEGRGILYVSHRLGEVLELCDQVTILRDGRVVASRPAPDLDAAAIVRLMTGRRVDGAAASAVVAQTAAGAKTPSEAAARPLLEVRHLSGRRVRDVSFSVYRGEVVGVAGLMGSGRSELLRLLGGAERPAAGEIRFEGRVITLRSPAQALRIGIARVPEERRAHALIAKASVRDNITLAHLGEFAAGGWWLRLARERQAAAAMVSRLQIRVRDPGQPIWQLSGGNQQKAVFARFLLRPPRLLLLDEPTRGVDVATRWEIYRLVRELKSQGTAVLMVSSELAEVLEMSDRILVLQDGRLVTTLDGATATEQALSIHMVGRQTP